MLRPSLALLIFFSVSLHATIQLPAIFGHNMVLQANKPLPMWGTAEPNEKIKIQVFGPNGVISERSTSADSQGSWKVTLPACGSGISGKVTISGSASDTLTFENILTGEVWVCSGQSNMEFQFKKANKPDAFNKLAGNNQIRLFRIPRTSSTEPATDVSGEWLICSPDSVQDFSAVGIFFGLELFDYLQQPIGLINASWGGTAVELWTPMEVLENDPGAAKALKEYKAKLAKIENQGGNLKSLNKSPSRLYNGMIHPLIPYAIQGVIWYQGEANSGNAIGYKSTFPLMIETWRKRWNQGDFPFLYVELAAYKEKQSQPVEKKGWAMIREAQREALKLPNTGVATAIDVGDEKDIHPKDKEPVGKRLAYVAEVMVYGKKGVGQSPQYKSYRIEGDRVVIELIDTGDGITYTPAEGLSGFAICGKDGDWKWADIKIEDDTLIVSNPNISEPKAVRYGWASYPLVTVTRKDGLPLLPFRTDTDSDSYGSAKE